MDPILSYHVLYGVSATSAADAWAVGFVNDGVDEEGNDITQTAIVHWDGAAWSQVTSPSPSPRWNELHGVIALSPDNAWAVGYYPGAGGDPKTLTVHWDGSHWLTVPSPNPGPYDNYLNGVSAVSSNDVWAVGSYLDASGQLRTLILHWNGTKWGKIRSPNPSPSHNSLNGVTAISPEDAWAVGDYQNPLKNNAFRTLTLHWSGGRWTRVWSPFGPSVAAPGLSLSDLNGVSAASPTDVWAVGYYFDSSMERRRLLIRWDGTKWSKQLPSRSVSLGECWGVDAVTPQDAWVASGYSPILHWDGASWSASVDAVAFDVDATSGTDAWAVGLTILHWDGATWSQS